MSGKGSRHQRSPERLRKDAMDGLQLYTELRRRGCRTPAIFITALDDPAVRKSVNRLGAAGLFRKPVDGDELLDAVKRVKSGVKQ